MQSESGEQLQIRSDRGQARAWLETGAIGRICDSAGSLDRLNDPAKIRVARRVETNHDRLLRARCEDDGKRPDQRAAVEHSEAEPEAAVGLCRDQQRLSGAADHGSIRVK